MSTLYRLRSTALSAVAGCVLAVCGLAANADVDARHETYTLDIPSQSLDDALQALALASQHKLFYQTDLVAGRSNPALKGAYTTEEAIRAILSKTDLGYEITPDGVVFIRSKAGARISQTKSPSTDGITATTEMAPREIAQAAADSSAASATADDANRITDEGRSTVEEIIVTAQKRSERLQDVPVPVTAIDTDALVNNNQLRLQDYFTNSPGLNVVPSIQSIQTVSIRGITTSGGNPTVGITVDDVPFGASTNTAGGRIVPDIDPGDLARIEVLRGPQGTLYGASSMGGLLKFVTRDPSMDRFSGRVQAGTSSVHNGADLGYNVRGSANVPLGAAVAIRASAFTRRDAGYIDNVATGEDSVNVADAKGGRLAGLWQLSEDLSLKASALYQKISGEGAQSADIALGDLQQSRVSGSGWYDKEVQAYSATLAAKVGSVDLTAISGYNINSRIDSLDAGFAYAGGAQGSQALFGVGGAQLISENESKKFTQEVRLSAPIGQRFEWLAGAFYTKERSVPLSTRLAENPASGVIVGRLQNSISTETFEEYAAFANLTFHVTDRFDVQVGGRESEIKETFTQTTFSAQNVQTVVPELNMKSSAFTYLVTPRFKLTPDLMMYARLASGYRAGGPNAFPGGVIPPQYNPDETKNYEIGVKGDFFNRLLSVDASLYYIDWQDLQFASLSPGSTTYLTNGGRAKSQGVELSVESRPVAGLTIAGWVAWSDAVLTEAFPAGSTAYGVAGTRLPDSSRFSGNLSIDQDFPLWNEISGFVGGSVSYVGDRVSGFRGLSAGIPLPRQTFSAYAQVDLRAGMTMDSWTVNVFATNIGDKRAALYGGLGALPATAFIYIQPRTIGLSLTRTF